MNDVCLKCRKPLKPGVIRPHPIRADLAVHSFECTNCGAVKTKVLFRKQSKVAAIGLDRYHAQRRKIQSAALGAQNKTSGAPANPEFVASVSTVVRG
jgi:hypothetical protein